MKIEEVQEEHNSETDKLLLEAKSFLKSLKSLDNVNTIIRHHHEKLDGSGYPDGLKDKEIDILTRIVSTVDIYDALITDRPYRKAMSQEQAFIILEGEAQKGLIDIAIIDILKVEVLYNSLKLSRPL